MLLIKSSLILLLITLLTFMNIASIGFPIILDLILIILIINFIKKNKIITLNINIIFIIFLILLTMVYKKEDNKIFYRGHEQFYKDNTSYKENINKIINILHGDLVAVDVCLKNPEEIIEKRKQIFITDKNGFRNSQIKIKNANLVLVGDSIIAGMGLSDEYILSNQVNSISNYKTVNLAIGSAGPGEYEAMILKHLDKINDNAKIFIFYFEGNDFEISNKDKIPEYSYNDIKMNKYKYKIRFGYERLERNKDKLFVKILNYENFFYKKIRPKSQRFYKKNMLKWTHTCEVQYELINNKLVGFLWSNKNKEYKYKTYIIENPLILKKINKVFFIPQKATVYKEYTNSVIDFESDKFLFLKKSNNQKNIDVINLTLPLKKNIKKYLQNNQFLFFRDDTHLNRNGTKVIANYILKNID